MIFTARLSNSSSVSPRTLLFSVVILRGRASGPLYFSSLLSPEMRLKPLMRQIALLAPDAPLISLTRSPEAN